MSTTVQNEARPAQEQTRRQEYILPSVNIFESKDGYVVEAEMPGVSKEGLEITLEGNEMTVLGHRQPETPSGDLLFRERRLVDYRRVFELDPAVDSSKVSAKMDQGVLKLTLPKSEHVKPRKIRVD